MKATILSILIMAMAVVSACQDDKQALISQFENNINEHTFPKEGARVTGEHATIQSRMEHFKIPGMSLSVIVDNKVDWQRSYGFLKAGKADMVDSNSLFQAGSVTKFVTALIVMHYVEKGVFNLDENINTYLKSWQMPVNEFNKDTPVTLRHLLSHQSGLPLSNMDREEDKPWPSLVQILDAESPAINKPATPEFTPGLKWSYSNIGYVVIQLVLEDMLGKDLEEIAGEVIFDPLGMDSSTFYYPLSPTMRHREAFPHTTDGEPREAVLDSHSRGQGGLIISTNDMSKLLIELMETFQGRSDRIISPGTMKAMLVKHTDIPEEALGFPIGMGLGVLVDGEGDDVSFMHPGHSYPGTVFLVVAFPGLGQGMAFGANNNIGDRLELEVASTLAEIYGWPSGNYFSIEAESQAGEP